MNDHLTQTTERTQQQHLQDKTSEPSCPTHSTLPDFTFSHAEFPPGMENTSFSREPIPAMKREKCGYRYIYIREHYSEQIPCTQHTHTSGYRARESSTELPTTEDGKFQHGGTSILQLQCRDHPTDGNFQEETWSRLNPNGKGITVTSS